MSDGGKGSAPRPYAVAQNTYDSNWDRIFGKNKKEESIATPQCYCYNCNVGYKDENNKLVTQSRMFVCPKCGNKRCPHSTNHSLACTNSNEPNQPGSRY